MARKSWRAADDQDLAYTHARAVEEAAREEKAQLQGIGLKEHSLGFNLYFVVCFIAASIPCVMNILLWSDMGKGVDCLTFLEENEVVSAYCAGYVGVLLIALYLLDFFIPPHLPGQYLTLSRHDPVVRFLILAQLGLGTACVGLFYSKEFPYLPALVTVLSSPVLIAIVREATRPDFAPPPRGSVRTSAGALQMLAKMLSEDIDERNFFAGAMTAFEISGWLTVFVWALWALTVDVDVFRFTLGNSVMERMYIRRVTPLFGGLANIVLGLMAMLRVMLARDYEGTNDLRVDLISEMEVMPSPEVESRESIIADFMKQQGIFQAFQLLEGPDQKAFARQEIHKMTSLFKTMKAIGISLVCLMGCIYVAAELVAADSEVAELLVWFLGLILLCFIAFLCASFGRLISMTKDWFLACPLGRMAVSVSQNDWARAFAFVAVLPATPPLLILSALNQLVRRFRGLYSRIPPRRTAAFDKQAEGAPEGANGHRLSSASLDAASIEVGIAAEDEIFTQWFTEKLETVRKWNWISVVPKIFIIAIFNVCYVLSPKLINVVLSWLTTALKNGVPFPVTIVLTIVAGITCFLLPPVPGLPVYLFAGAVIAKTRPDGLGFWAGCAISVSMSMVLKVVACAMQQKLIGEALGTSIWVKSQVGVNKPFFRAVERILQQPGISWGKVAILCGGPDWPTSVLCGLLRCSLLQMELGTLPIIFFIAPCTLYGAFYTRQQESEVWANATSLMLLASVAMNMVFGIGAAWAVQEELDMSHWEVTKPLEKYIDLDWLDYRSAQIAESCVVQWRDVPLLLRLFALGCALVEVGVCHVLYFMPAVCFGSFNITDDISTLVWYGEQGLFKLQGVVVLSVQALGMTGYFALGCFLKKTRAGAYASKAARLDVSEAAWKEQRAHLALKARTFSVKSASELLRCSQRLSQASKVSTMSGAARVQNEPQMKLPVRRIEKE
mmetsp:Transcript_5508/g.14641  ORF Transcript_5508/g.14641 Transcript_5508/m.14641 type:complete len:954 (-) Transcript_5508:145-3006(-)